MASGNISGSTTGAASGPAAFVDEPLQEYDLQTPVALAEPVQDRPAASSAGAMIVFE